MATPAGESLDAMLARLAPMFFDAGVDPIVTNKAPGPGKDILLASANNLYSGVSLAEAEAFKKAGLEKNGLNSRLVKQNGKLVEEVYKVGGRYSKEITAIVSHLEAAIPFAPETDGQRAARADPVVPHRRRRRPREVRHRLGGRQGFADRRRSTASSRSTSTRAASRAAGRAWSSSSTGRRPSASASSPTTRSGSRTTCPSTPKYRKANVKGIVANAIDVVVETGDSGPVTPVGINLPNDQRIREEYGSKSVSLSNVNEAYDKSHAGLDAQRVLVDAGRGGAQREVRDACRASCTPTCTR